VGSYVCASSSEKCGFLFGTSFTEFALLIDFPSVGVCVCAGIPENEQLMCFAYFTILTLLTLPY